MKKFLWIFVIIFLSFLFKTDFSLAEDNQVNTSTEIYLFYLSTCPHCKAEEAFLTKIEPKYPGLQIKKYEISDSANSQIYQEMADKYKVPKEEMGFVPLTIIGNQYFIGYDKDQTTGQQLEVAIQSLIGGNPNSCPSKTSPQSITLFGKIINISDKTSLTFMAMVFGLANGINPCTISVLLILLAYLLTTSSFKQAIKLGIVFSISVFLIYFGLLIGVYKSVCLFQSNLLTILDPLKRGLGVVLFLFGILMAKDFFFLKEGEKVSFAIPKFAHPIIKKFISYATLPTVILLALFSSLAELPCSFALPLSYATILAEKTKSPYPYFLLYSIFFVLPLFIVVAIVGFGFSKTENVEAWRMKFRKNSRLVSGILLVILGLAFLFGLF